MEEYQFTIEKCEGTVPVAEYLETCVDVPQFLGYCRQCSNFGKVWSCPEFDFDPVAYVSEYDELYILGYKVIIPEELRLRVFSDEEREAFLKQLLDKPKRQLDDDLLELEGQTPGSIALSGGSCLRCLPAECARIEGKPCRKPDKLRYSIEALGGNVGLTVTKYLHEELQWIEKGRLPKYFILVGGLLKKHI